MSCITLHGSNCTHMHFNTCSTVVLSFYFSLLKNSPDSNQLTDRKYQRPEFDSMDHEFDVTRYADAISRQRRAHRW